MRYRILHCSSVDIVSMMDVAYHLIADDANLAVLASLRRVLVPEGLFIFRESFKRRERGGTNHYTVSRPWKLAAAWLDHVYLSVVARYPQYVLMKRPTNLGLDPLCLSKRFVSRLTKSTETGAWLISTPLAPIDILATRLKSTSPSIELVVCRRCP